MKEYKQILILGGYGNTGRPLAEYLLRETAVDLVLAGRNLDQAQETASQFNEQFADQRVSTAFADAAKPISLRQAFAAENGHFAGNVSRNRRCRLLFHH
jgi:saccharopine dehydrogenase (NAD+, L-lysine-forming)